MVSEACVLFSTQASFQPELECALQDDGRPKDKPAGLEEKTRFHGQAPSDASGRSWMDAPKDQRAENEFCYIPKRHIHTWSGHTKGVNAIKFFPESGHLLLSAGLDGKVKIWDVLGSGKCMRTYLGFTKVCLRPQCILRLY